ncbi:MAG TPA: 2,3-bisphosphoglycerate-independent phosphoglycerate mutase [Candidatus Saccharicenans sp.]|jgi:2,3-bisphosphoglycerate-independent phosphoglycerate mutase|nr:2,3-bisphosphoglycerate-independent phosphoglycerate mutase [Candidatus Saccharicenans sp.]HRD01467.1 2,3-bisphosphoglycerate-independent phosphoglycerate mutase [Candidatus Saccharicenans sp.]
MEWEKIAEELTQPTDSKIILLVMDGLGGLPVNGLTELETARRPNLNEAARRGICGVTDPVFMGITPGSGPAHLALFGYDPLKYQLGRGILEAMGTGVEVGRDDVVARGNFATLKDGLVVDRRAGRLATSENSQLCALINETIKEIRGVKVSVFPGKEHRFVFKLSGPGLSEAITDCDPQKEGQPPLKAVALEPEAELTASLVNEFITRLSDLLKDQPKANYALLRGFAKFPSHLPPMPSLYKVKPASIANYPMYRGLTRLLGMEVLEVGPDTAEIFDVLEKHYADYNFFYLHFKKTDSAGEDGRFEDKVKAIEEIDQFIPRLWTLKPDVLVITSDHSTPSTLKSHSWHPNPFVLISPRAEGDDVAEFSQKACTKGALGRFQSIYAMPLMLAYALKLKKFGA